MRLFIALEVPLPIRKRLYRIARSLADKVHAVRPVRPENIHLTVHFLGDVEEPLVSGICNAITAVAESNAPFDARIESLGCFGRRRSPSVLWAGVEEERGLLKMQAELGAKLKSMSLTVEERGFHPHLTIARVKQGRRANRLSSLLEEYSDQDLGVLHSGSVSLVKSSLTPDGAVYETLLKAPLAK
jgi:2'-5' RNA ligase